MPGLRIFLAVGWIVMLVVTARATALLGLDGATIFFSDFAQPWRAQFNTDFSLHLLLFAAWVLYREPRWYIGALCVLGTLNGGIFTLAYLLVATFRARGDMHVLLLGRHAPAFHR